MTTYLITNFVTWVGFTTLHAGDRLVVAPGGGLVMPGTDLSVLGAGGPAGISFGGYVYLDQVTVNKDVSFTLTSTGQFVSDTEGAGLQIGGTASTATGQTRLDTAGEISVLNGIGIQTWGAQNIILNTGRITADVGVFLASNLDSLTNSGTITGITHAVHLQDFGLSLTNLGSLAAASGSAVLVDGDSASVTNSGSITGPVMALELATDISFHLTNSGTITGAITSTGASADVIANSGTISGDVSLGAGNDSFGGGHLVGNLDMGLGDDTVDARGAAISGMIRDAGGDDTYYVDSASTRLFDSGPGKDLVLAWSSFRLDSGLEALTLMGAGDLSGGGNGLANQINGNEGNNILTGGGGQDRLAGNGGDDDLRGGLGADQLFGGDGADILRGGAGRDVMTGGADGDAFVFSALSQSGADTATADLITDFTPDEDHIDLSALDAVRGNSRADDAFTFIGSEDFGHVAGQLQVTQSNGMTWVALDVDGNGAADALIGLSGLLTLTAGDFVL
jgi:Ca2+-binding RTX toxin-like protein